MSTQTNSANQTKTSASDYLKGVRAELKKVSWPTRAELINYTVVVLVTCSIASIGFYLIDSVFHFGLKLFM